MLQINIYREEIFFQVLKLFFTNSLSDKCLLTESENGMYLDNMYLSFLIFFPSIGFLFILCWSIHRGAHLNQALFISNYSLNQDNGTDVGSLEWWQKCFMQRYNQSSWDPERFACGRNITEVFLGCPQTSGYKRIPLRAGFTCGSHAWLQPPPLNPD